MCVPRMHELDPEGVKTLLRNVRRLAYDDKITASNVSSKNRPQP